MKKKPGVYTAKNGRKYRILANGRARFISNKEAAGSSTKKKVKRTRRRRKGGAMRTGGGAMSGGAMRTGGFIGNTPMDQIQNAYYSGKGAYNQGKSIVKKARSLIHY